MIKLANALDKAGIKYIWYIFTNDIDEIPSKNVVYMKPRLDISYWLEQADYLVQLSDTEACSYSINEALYRNIPVIVTPLPYLEEIGIKDSINSYIMEFDCSNIDYIVNNIKTKPSFQFNKLEDDYNNILANSKSYYKEEMKNMELLEVIEEFTLGRFEELQNIIRKNPKTSKDGTLYVGDIFECKKELAKYLKGDNDYKRAVVKEIEIKKEVEKKIEEKKKEPVKKTTRKTTKRK